MNLASNSFELNNEIDVIASVTVTSTAVNEAVIKASSIWSEYISNGKIDEQVMDSSSEETTGKESTQDNKGEEYDIQSIMNEVLNNGLEYEATTVDNGQYYLSDESVGILTSTKGMVDDVVVLTITDLEGRIIDVVVVEQNDTPSIGEKVIEEEWFTDQYHEMNLLSNSFELNNEIDVIASVTVTSKAVNDSVIKAAELFKENIEEGAGQ
jgi:Na+-translocating ferredoxin:NAD+ oxidoreductase RnfG subunit